MHLDYFVPKTDASENNDSPLLFKAHRGETISQSIIANVVAEGVEVIDLVLNNVSPNAPHPFQ